MRRPILAILALILLAGAMVLAGSDEVRALVASARYGEARLELARDMDLRTTTGGRVLSARLDRNPATAMELLGQVLEESDSDSELGREAALDAAGIALGAGLPREALTILEPLLAGNRNTVPGQALLMAGLAARALGETDRAERLLAGVRPGDPSFGTARVVLGELSLERADPQRALRYFEAAETGSRAAAGRWQAYRLMGEDGTAAALLAELERQDPGGLSLLEINRRRRQEADEAAARHTATTEAPADPVAVAPPTGRYTLQFGAWSDRSRALDMLHRYQDMVADLRIEETRDEQGQILYKVRAGAYDNPALARSEARRLKDQLGLDVFVADRSD